MKHCSHGDALRYVRSSLRFGCFAACHTSCSSQALRHSAAYVSVAKLRYAVLRSLRLKKDSFTHYVQLRISLATSTAAPPCDRHLPASQPLIFWFAFAALRLINFAHRRAAVHRPCRPSSLRFASLFSRGGCGLYCTAVWLAWRKWWRTVSLPSLRFVRSSLRYVHPGFPARGLQCINQLWIIATINSNTDQQTLIFKQSLQASKKISTCLPPPISDINTDEL